jgi:hypothetical protein
MRLEVRCHCGQHAKVHDLSSAPVVRAELDRIRKAKLKRELKKFGKKPPKGKDLGAVRRRAEPTEQDHSPELRAYLRGWGSRTLAMGYETEVVHFACGSVFRYRVDVTQPLGVRLEDETPPEKRRPRDSSEGADRTQPGARGTNA